MRNRLLLIGAILLGLWVASPSFGDQAVVYYDDYYSSAEIDTLGGVLDSANPDTFYSMRTNSQDVYNQDSVTAYRHLLVPLKFTSSDIPTDSIINSVTLRVGKAEDLDLRASRTFNADLLSRTPDTPTWNEYDSVLGSSWSTIVIANNAHSGSGDSGGLLATDSSVSNAAEWMELDVTSAFTSPYDGSDVEVIFLCRTGGIQHSISFYGQEGHASRPNLVIDYTAPTPTPTETFTPSNTPTQTPTPTPTNTGEPTATFTNTFTHTPTFTPTATFTATVPSTPTPTMNPTLASMIGDRKKNRPAILRGVGMLMEGLAVIDDDETNPEDARILWDRDGNSLINFTNFLSNSSFHQSVNGWTANASGSIVHSASTAFTPIDSGSLKLIATADLGAASTVFEATASTGGYMTFGFVYHVTSEMVFGLRAYHGGEVSSVQIQRVTREEDQFSLASLTFPVSAGESVTACEVYLPFNGGVIAIDNVGLYDAGHWPGYSPDTPQTGGGASFDSISTTGLDSTTATIEAATVTRLHLGMTEGSVPYISSVDDLEEDNVGLFFAPITNRLGVNTNAPDYSLDVAGNAGIDEYFYHNGDANTYWRFLDDRIVGVAGGVQMLDLRETTQDEISFGYTGVDIDHQFNSATNDNALFIRGSDGAIGIGTGSPSSDLDLSKADGSGDIILEFDSSGSSDMFIRLEDSNDALVLSNSNGGDDLTIETSTGYIGLNTLDPNTNLHVAVDAGTVPALAAGTGVVINNSSDAGDDVGLSLVSGTSGDCWIYMGDSADEDVLRMNFSNSSSKFSMVNAGTTILNWGTTFMQYRVDQEFNYNNEDRDFAVNDDTDDNALFVQGSDGFIGLNNGAPEVILHVVGSQGTNPSFSGSMAVFENTATTGSSAYLAIVGGNAADTGIYLGDQNSMTQNRITMDHGTGLEFFVEGSENVVFEADDDAIFNGAIKAKKQTSQTEGGSGPHDIDTTNKTYIPFTMAISASGNYRLDQGEEGQLIILHCVLDFSGLQLVDDSANSDAGSVRLNGSITFTSDTTLTLICDGTDWVEISRSVN